MRTSAASFAKPSHPRLPAIVPRKRLFQLLDRCRKRSIVWVSGPPGAGKTTLAASYIRARKLNSLWYQIDESDEDVASFFHNLRVAAESVPARSRQVLPRLGPEHRTTLPRFARLFFARLYQRAKPPFVLVFDNYQELSSESPLHGLIAEGLSVIPEKMNVFVLSREFSPPALSPFRVRRNLARVAPEALRLTLTEARAICRLYAEAQSRSSCRRIEEMHRNLQGWAAGLVLFLEHASYDPDSVPFPTNEALEVIFDYLAQEVLQRQSSETRRFFLETGFLPRMTLSTAEALTGNASAGQLIAAQYRNRFFIERREAPDPVYQYHPLFRDFLRRQACREMTPVELKDLKTRAAKCLENAGHLEDAMALLRELSDLDGQIRLIGAHASTLLAQGRFQTLEEWIRAIPANRRFQDPWLLNWLASCRLLTSPEESETLFEEAFELFSRDENREATLLAWCGVLDSILLEWRDVSRLPLWLERFPEVLDGEYPNLPPELEGRLVSTVFTSLLWGRPQDSRMQKWASRALQQVRESKDLTLAASTGHFLVVYFSWIGDRAPGDEVIALLRERISESAPPLARLYRYLAEGIQAWVTGEPEASLRMLEDGLEVADQNEIAILDGPFQVIMIQPWIYQGRLAEAAKHLEGMAVFVRGKGNYLSGVYHFLCSWIAILRGDFRGAWDQARIVLKGSPRTVGPFGEAVSRLGAAIALFEMGRQSSALSQVSRVERFAHEMGSAMLLFSCKLNRSAFALAQGGAESSVLLREAMTLGRERDFVDALFWEPGRMARLCARALEEGIEADYVRKLVRRRNLAPPPDASESWPWAVRVRALGGFEVAIEGEPVRSSRKTQHRPLSLLKAIVAHGGKPVAEERLADLLWPESEGDRALQSLNITIHRLRKLLRHPEALAIRNRTLSLDSTCCWVDAWELESVARRAMDMEDPTRIAKLARRAVELYRGPLLPDDTIEPWPHPARERLERLLERLTRRLAEWERSESPPQDLEFLRRALEKRLGLPVSVRPGRTHAGPGL